MKTLLTIVIFLLLGACDALETKYTCENGMVVMNRNFILKDKKGDPIKCVKEGEK